MAINNKEDNTEQTFGLSYIKEFFIDIIDLKHGVNKQATIDEIKGKNSMSGANAWMLMCSIIIASIGLDRDSDAVIIGAMLISPLMSPILGIGLGIGINDKDVVKKSVIHFSAAIIIALITSYIYFIFSPFGHVTPNIAARTEPLTLDVLVAVFGGLAGIISIARKDISTTLPGVAIATALMPPLCVTGFGLAKGNWTFAINSFYLFILNTSFISLSTYIIVRYLRFPYRRYVNPKDRLRNRIVVSLFSLLIIIPSFFILKNVLNNLQTTTTVEMCIEEALGEDLLYLDSYTEQITDSTSTLILKVYGDVIDDEKINQLETKMISNGLTNWGIQIIQSSEVNTGQINSLADKIADIETLTKRQIEIKRAEMRVQALASDSTLMKQVTDEFTTIFDNTTSVAFAKMQFFSTTKRETKIPTFIVEQERRSSEEESEKMETFLKIRMNLDTLKLIKLAPENKGRRR